MPRSRILRLPHGDGTGLDPGSPPSARLGYGLPRPILNHRIDALQSGPNAMERPVPPLRPLLARSPRRARVRQRPGAHGSEQDSERRAKAKRPDVLERDDDNRNARSGHGRPRARPPRSSGRPCAGRAHQEQAGVEHPRSRGALPIACRIVKAPPRRHVGTKRDSPAFPENPPGQSPSFAAKPPHAPGHWKRSARWSATHAKAKSQNSWAWATGRRRPCGRRTSPRRTCGRQRGG